MPKKRGTYPVRGKMSDNVLPLIFDSSKNPRDLVGGMSRFGCRQRRAGRSLVGGGGETVGKGAFVVRSRRWFRVGAFEGEVFHKLFVVSFCCDGMGWDGLCWMGLTLPG